jgi:hypothetical protein
VATKTTTSKLPPVDDPQTIGDLLPDRHNRRKRTARNVDMIVTSLKDVGASRSIVIDETNEVLAGNGVIEAAAQAGISRIQVVEADGDTIIAVRRRGLSADQKRALAIFDNRAAELAEWDGAQLAEDFQAFGTDGLTPFFTEAELQKLKVLPKPAVEDVANQVVPDVFMVIITCADEADQVRMLERFAAEGLTCKALVS